jgi:hypothetical protein
LAKNKLCSKKFYLNNKFKIIILTFKNKYNGKRKI